MIGPPKFNGSCELTIPLSVVVVTRKLGLFLMNLPAKFEVSNSTHYEDMEGDTKWVVLGRMSLFFI